LPSNTVVKRPVASSRTRTEVPSQLLSAVPTPNHNHAVEDPVVRRTKRNAFGDLGSTARAGAAKARREAVSMAAATRIEDGNGHPSLAGVRLRHRSRADRPSTATTLPLGKARRIVTFVRPASCGSWLDNLAVVLGYAADRPAVSSPGGFRTPAPSPVEPSCRGRHPKTFKVLKLARCRMADSRNAF